MIHIYQPGGETELLLLHGTGGTEHDLLEIGRSLAPEASLLGVRGEIKENGMNRWFKRYSEGVFDEQSIIEESAKLAEFLRTRPVKKRIALGYSNGANIGASLMLLHPDVLDGLIMWRGMLPLRPTEMPDLASKSILMTNGAHDPMAPQASAKAVAELFRSFGANVEAHEFATGHGLTQGDFVLTSEWLKLHL
jgi:phospholipase/carboxylesterase